LTVDLTVFEHLGWQACGDTVSPRDGIRSRNKGRIGDFMDTSLDRARQSEGVWRTEPLLVNAGSADSPWRPPQRRPAWPGSCPGCQECRLRRCRPAPCSTEVPGATVGTRRIATVPQIIAVLAGDPVEPAGKARTVSIAPVAPVDHRTHRRVEFFLVSNQRERVPVWVFKPADAVDAIAGLVMNLSDGGLQVLSASDAAPVHAAYEIQLLLGEDETVARFRGRVTRVWTREADSAGWLSGLRFDDAHSSAEDFIRAYQSAAPDTRWVRCLLVPRH
jgi:hypothetical protein